MRRKVSLLMAAVCLIGLLAGCRSKPATTFIIGDEGQKELPLVTMLIDPGVSMESTGFIQFLKTVPGHDREFHVEMEMLPQGATGVVRRQRLQRVRTEIMAGKGPDIFICENYNTVTVDVRELGGDMAEGGLFKYPYGVMDNHLLLPLDKYIENAQYMDFGQLEPKVMAAGRNDEGQQILPLTFDFYAAAYVPSSYGLPQERPKTRREMLDSGCARLDIAAKGMYGDTLLDYFPDMVDWDNETLNFTEDEFTERTLDYWDASQKRLSGEYVFAGDRDDGAMLLSQYLMRFQPYEGTILAPEYNKDGGVSAYVTNFAAINRNTKYPDYAFAVLDKLLSKEEQNMPRIYKSSFRTGLPVYTGATGDAPALGGGTLPEHLAAQYSELLEMVDDVRFLNMLDNEMVRSVKPVCEKPGSTQEDVEKAAREAYRAMQMMLAES